ncbi:MAG: transporter [Thermoleophilaceae bacterium]|nr:transporter [Thermoleophilaceae bacterium]
MIVIAAVVLAATAFGVWLERRIGVPARRGGERSMSAILWVALPIVAFFNVARLELSAEVGAGIAYGYGAVIGTMALAWLIGTRVLRLARPALGALMLAAALGNTGYLGLPFVTVLLGHDSLPDAVVYDVFVSSMALISIGFAVGAAFGTRGETPRERATAFITRNPPLWATLAALAVPDALAPDLLVDASRLLLFAILPVGFTVVGIVLSAESAADRIGFPPPMSKPVGTALVLKLGVAPAIAAALSASLLRVPDAYLVQAGMASAIASLLVANEYGLDRPIAAGAIAWSTALVVSAGLAAALL